MLTQACRRNKPQPNPRRQLKKDECVITAWHAHVYPTEDAAAENRIWVEGIILPETEREAMSGRDAATLRIGSAAPAA
ncbi:MAG: hypothetical protein ACLPKB_36050 [Xanthobacteraceae bacterium]